MTRQVQTATAIPKQAPIRTRAKRSTRSTCSTTRLAPGRLGVWGALLSFRRLRRAVPLTPFVFFLGGGETGYKIPVLENLGATLDQFDTVDFSDNEVRKLDGFPLLKRLKTLLMNNNRIW